MPSLVNASKIRKNILKNFSQAARNADFYADFKTVEKFSQMFT
jgi:hypothetical protein